MTKGEFASKIRARFPEGLTGAVAVGGTRTTFILENNRNASDPGRIDDFAFYADFLVDRYQDFIRMFLDLGGQNLIITALGYQSFFERGDEYAAQISDFTHRLIDEKFASFYREAGIDPYFLGIDTLLQLPEEHAAHRLGADLESFQKHWRYQSGRHKVFWEIASIPLFSLWNAIQSLDEQTREKINTDLKSANDLQSMHQSLYGVFMRAIYQTDIPTPHFYLGSNRNGSLKLRSVMPVALLCGDPFQLFYTPYPTLNITQATFQAILEDLAFGKPLRSTDKDYSQQYSADLVEKEYQRVRDLSADPFSSVGLTRQIPHTSD